MAHAAEASSTIKLAGFVAESEVPPPPPPQLALIPQDAGNHSGSAAASKGKEVVQSFTLALPSSEVSPPARLPSTELLLQNYGNFSRTAGPSRFMYFENGEWLDFSSEVLDQIRPAFADRRAMVDLSIDGSKYLFDFMRMLQIDFETENCWSVSWIDENGKCFFPKVSIGKEEEQPELENNQYIENSVNNSNHNTNHRIELVIKLDDSALKRKREEFEANPPPIMALPIPPATAPIPIIADGVARRPRLVEVFRWPKAMILREDDKEYILVKDYFMSGVTKLDPRAQITAIYKCTREGTSEKARYEFFQKQVERIRAIRGPNASQPIYAWHGASAKDVTAVLSYGFQSPSKVPPSDVYGVGVYLSPVSLAQLSAYLAEVDENGEKHVILCRILLGNVEKVEFGSQQDRPSSVEFDIGADDHHSPSWYVVWPCNMNEHILPEFVVSYKRSVYAKGKMRVASDEELLSKVQSSLPPSAFQEVMQLYKIYRAGLMTKDAFVKHLRSIAGDDILRAIMLELDASG